MGLYYILNTENGQNIEVKESTHEEGRGGDT
jgi:hypothetical protein